MLIAWALGEYLAKRLSLPRISSYVGLGFILGAWLTESMTLQWKQTLSVLAQIAFALHLFETGYRIHLTWFRSNPWLLISGLSESALSFALVFALGIVLQFSYLESCLMAALLMATSPSSLILTIQQMRASGQLTERVLHHTAISLVLAVVVVQMVLGVQSFEHSGSWREAIFDGLVVASLSITSGIVLGFLIPELLRSLRRAANDATLAFALGVAFLCALSLSLKLSPMLSCFAFGVVCRYQRMAIGLAKKGFGTAGDLLSILLFVYVGASVPLVYVLEGGLMALIFLLARQLAKSIAVTGLAFSGALSWKKGFWVSVALSPAASFLLLMAVHLENDGLTSAPLMHALFASALITGVLAPVLVHLAILRSKESLVNEGP